MSVLTIIPARAGSKRCPGKNWEKVGGRSLIQRALDCVLGDYAAIVTDAPDRCPPINNDFSVPFLTHLWDEPKRLAGDNVSMGTVVEWVCSKEKPAEVVILLQPTSPLRTKKDVGECLRILTTSHCDSVVSVTYDLATKSYRRNGAVYMTRGPRAARGELMGGWTQFYVMPPERSIDINTPKDLVEARRLAGDG